MLQFYKVYIGEIFNANYSGKIKLENLDSFLDRLRKGKLKPRKNFIKVSSS